MKVADVSRVAISEILVVEDDAELRAVVRDVLLDAGFAVVVAANGSVALDHLLGARSLPSLILLDLKMPIMSGREMIRVLQGYVRLSRIPVVVMTSEALLAENSEEGAVGRLQKPFDVRQLLSAVRRYVLRSDDGA